MSSKTVGRYLYPKAFRRAAMRLSVVAAGLGLPGVASAQSYSWNLPGNGTWDTTSLNWLLNGTGSPVANPGGTNAAVFGTAISANATIAVAAGGVSSGGITFDNSGTFLYTVGSAGNNITLNAGGASDSVINVNRGVVGANTYGGAGGNTITGSNIVFSNNLAITNNGAFGTTSLTIAGNIDRSAAGGQIVVGGQGNTLVSGAIGATITGGIVKNGSGTLILSSATNAFTGGATINEGVLAINSNDAMLGAAANGVTINGGGTFRFNNTVTTARTYTINGSAVNPSGIDLASAVTATLTGGLSGTGVARLSVTGGTSGIFAVQGSNAGFTGTLNVGAPGTVVGSVFAQRIFATTANATVRVDAGLNGRLANLTGGITVNNASLLNVNQPATGNATTGSLTGSAMTFNNGRFTYTTNANSGTNGGAAIAETFGSVTTTGLLTISGSSVAGTANGTTLNFGALTRQDNGMLLFRSPATGTGSIGGAPGTGIRYFFSNLTPETTTSGTTRSVIPWAGTVASTTGTDPESFMTYDADGFRPLNLTTEVVVLSAANTLAGAAAGTNIRTTLSGATQTVAAGGQTINSFGSSTTQTVTAAATTDILTNTSGAYATFNTFTFSNTTVSNPNGAYFTLGFPFAFTGTSSLTGANGVSVASFGSSTSYQLRFTNTVANTFTGGLFINGNAQVTFIANNLLGQIAGNVNAGAISLGGGQLIYNAAAGSTETLADGAALRPIFVNGSNGTIGTSTAGSTLIIPGTISGTGQLQFGGGAAVSATGIVELTNASANSYTGGTLVSSGILRFSNVNQLGTGGVLLNGGTLQAATSATNSNLNFAQTVRVIATASTIDTQDRTITLVGGLGGTSGTLGVSATTANLVKNGTGVLTITGDGNYAGTIALNAGNLTISGGGRLSELGTVTVGNGATFGIDNAIANIANRTGRATNVTLANGGVTGGANLTLTTNVAGSSFTLGTLAVTGGIAAGVNSSVLTIVDGGAGNNTITFASLTSLLAFNNLSVVGTTNLGRDTGGGSRIFFSLPPTLSAGIIPNVTFTGFNGTGPATYDPALGLIRFIAATASGTVIDNIGAPALTTNVAFTTTGDTVAKTGARISQLVLDAGATLTLTQTYAAAAGNGGGTGNGNTPIDTLSISASNLTSQTSPKTITATTTGVLSFGATTANITTTTNLTIASSVATVAAGLTKAGAGTLTIAGANNITGDYAINAGNVTFNSNSPGAGGLSSAAGTTITLGAGTTFTTTAGTNTTLAGTLTGSGAFVKAGTGTLTMTGTNTGFTGPVTISGAGSISTDDFARLGTGLLTFDGGGVLYTGASAFNFPSATVTANGALFGVGTAGVIGSLATGISTAGTVTKTGAGTLALATATVNNIGLLAVNAGVIDVNGNDLTVGGLSGTGGTLAMGANNLTVNGTGVNTTGSAITGTGTFVKAGSGTQNFSTVALGTIAQTTVNITGGTLALTGSAAITFAANTNFTLSPGTTLDFGTAGNNNTDPNAFGLITATNATVRVSGGSSDMANKGLVLTGSTFDLTGSSNFWWHVRIAGSTIVTNASSLTTTLAGPTSGSRFQNDTGAALPVIVAAGTTPSGIDLNVTGLLSNNAITTAVTSFDKQGAGVMQIAFPGTTTAAFSVAAGTLQVVAGSTISGFVTVNGGTFRGTGTVTGTLTVNSGGNLAPGLSPGILTVANTTLASGANFNVEINGTTAGTQYDQLGVTGTLDLANATLNALFGFVPTVGQTFTIVNKTSLGAITGTFNGLAEGATFNASGNIVSITYVGGTDTNDVILTVITPVPEPASMMLIGGAVVGFVGWRRRRNSKIVEAV